MRMFLRIISATALSSMVFSIASAQVPPPTNPNLRHFGYYFADGRYGDFSSEVFPYTNLYVAIPDGYDTNNPNWQPLLSSSLQNAVANNKDIYLIMREYSPGQQVITWDAILDTTAPFWSRVAYIDVAQESDILGLTAAQMEAKITTLKTKLDARGLSYKPFGVTFQVGDVLTNDALYAPSLSFAAVEAYVDNPSADAAVTVASLNGFLDQAKDRIRGAGKSAVLIMQGFDRGQTFWQQNLDVLVAIQDPVYLKAYNDPVVVAITIFAYGRPGGTRQYAQLQSKHRDMGAALTVTSPVQVSVVGSSAKAGAPARFTLTLGGPANHAVYVNYQTINGTAVAPQDFTATSGTVVIPQGLTSTFVDVPTVGDAPERDETFSFSVSGGAIPASGTATIRNRPKGDLNGDGQADLVFQRISPDNGNIGVWLMNGTTVTGAIPLESAGAGWEIVGMGDFNQDGYQDFVQQTVAGVARIWTMRDLEHVATFPLPPLTDSTGAPNWRINAVGDFNGDRHDDIVIRHTAGHIAVWQMNGTTVVSSGFTTPSTVGTVWQIYAAGDFNANGQTDLIWQATTTNPASNGWLVAWLMTGTVNQSTVNLSPAFEPDTNWKIRASADLNGDGRPDLWWHHQQSGSITWWLMNGTALSNSGLLAETLDPTVYRIVGPLAGLAAHGKGCGPRASEALV